MEPEQNNIEYKTTSRGRLPNDLWQTVSAFANSDGGKIYFGVRPDGTREPLSSADIDKIQRDFSSLCMDAMSVKIIPEFKVENGTIVAIIEPTQAANRPVYRLKNGLERGTFVRIGSANIRADGEILKRLIAASRGGVETLEYDYYWKRVFDLEAVGEYVSLLNSRNDDVYQKFSIEEILVKQKAISTDCSKVTLFGILAFGAGREPQDILAPTVNIAVTQYTGIDKIDPENLDETYVDNREFNGSVAKQFKNALGFIKSRLPARGIVENGIRREMLVIPEVAIREALANAIVHRDYSTYVSRVQVDIFADRVEIVSPGHSLVPIGELDTAPSTSRNPLLMNYMKELGITDQKGRGIRTIVSTIKDRDLLDPVFSDDGRSFKVILFSQSIFTESDREFLNSLQIDMNHRQKRATAYALKHKEGVTNSLYRDINNMRAVRDDKKANKELKELVEYGIFTPVGSGKGRRYILK